MMLSEYLVSSRDRRTLLHLLIVDQATGSARELAKQAGVAYFPANTELRRMVEAGLADVVRKGAANVFRARRGPAANLVRKLLLLDSGTNDTVVKSSLVALGAPLVWDAAAAAPSLPLEETLARAAKLARQDVGVHRTLAFVFATWAGQVDYDRLFDEANRWHARRETGLYLELAGRASGNETLTAAAERFVDRRHKRREYFEQAAQADKWHAELVRSHTPAFAKRWGFWANLSVEDTAQFLNVHRHAA